MIIAITIFYFSPFLNQEKEITVGETNFHIPDGYHVGNQTKLGSTNLTNGTNEIYIQMYDGQNISAYVDDYVNSSAKKNYTIKISSFNIGNNVVYKSTSNNISSVHYWFLKDKKVYTIYSWQKNPKMDSISSYLIESMK